MYGLYFYGGIFTGIFEAAVIGAGLAMDAFAVSISDGLCLDKNKSMAKKIAAAFACALTFGLFQGIMPAMGFVLGKGFGSLLEKIDHYIALVLLCFIGLKMIFQAAPQQEKVEISLKILLVQGLATSLDAFAAGISFGAISENIVLICGIICLVTFILSLVGFFLGGKFSRIISDNAQIFGGIILVLMGVKVFVQHIFM